MAKEIRVPTLGESVSEATVGKWLKKAGDAVKADEVLLELETDKVSIEVPSPASGTLSEISVKEGDTVAPGGLLGMIAEGAQAAAPAPAKSAEPAKAAPAPAAASSMPPAPAAAKIMADSGVSVDAGSGKRGQVLKSARRRASARDACAPRDLSAG
jgi:2-oxoglutarate dehydrogenase E2 component (dihydrolipoamide succinyltransferase)